jgi:hypothetical protein
MFRLNIGSNNFTATSILKEKRKEKEKTYSIDNKEMIKYLNKCTTKEEEILLSDQQSPFNK